MMSLGECEERRAGKRTAHCRLIAGRDSMQSQPLKPSQPR